MNILHLYSDWRWTGPADPVLNMCKKLQERGHNIIFAYRKPLRDIAETIERFARERNINTTDMFNLNRYFNITDNIKDIRRLKDFIFERKIEIVNAHLTHDHVIGGIACCLTSNKTVVIRTDHRRDPFKSTFGNRFLLKNLTDGIITFSTKSRRKLIEEFGISENNVVKIMPAIDSNVFNPDRQFTDMRKKFGISEKDIVVGIVTRFQKYRKMDMFFKAFSKVIAEMPNVKALLLGSSSKMKETVYEPVKRLNLEKKCHCCRISF
jgi:glycosyltransferase involved in cell wall biosynthesis